MSNKKRRPDLEALPVKFPNYIGHMIAPWYVRTQRAGTFSYQPLLSDISVQSGRDTAAIGSITTQATLTAVDMSFACVEKRTRVRIGYDQVDSYGGKAKADIAMGRKAKRGWMNSFEQDIADMLLKTSATDISTDVVAGIDTYVALLQDLAQGPVALCLSHHNFVLLKNNATVKDRLKNSGIAINANGDPRRITADQLAIIFNCDKVLVGPDAEWYTGVGAYKNNAGLVILPDENEEPVDEPQFARTLYYEWDTDADFFYMESFDDDKEDASYVDAKGHRVVKKLNADMAMTLQLFAAGGDDDSSSSSDSSESSDSSSSDSSESSDSSSSATSGSSN
ncbi:MAG: hypothetical protein IJS08_15380 [Victivallales bacterium]|nr:hypothetical protein [Victivallales bacterium]